MAEAHIGNVTQLDYGVTTPRNDQVFKSLDVIEASNRPQ